ncbi:hypothetical protein HC823_01475 [Candidatus Gracilibacteria bacterium]|nr:hypothetical protein [Candidatus Gracilibacteria bacterium]
MKKVLLLGLGIVLSAAMFSPADAMVNNVRCWEDGSGNSCDPYTNWRSVRSTAIQSRMKDDAGITAIREFADKLQNQNTRTLGTNTILLHEDLGNGARDEAYQKSEYNVTEDSRQRKLFPLREARAERNKAQFPVLERNQWWWNLY